MIGHFSISCALANALQLYANRPDVLALPRSGESGFIAKIALSPKSKAVVLSSPTMGWQQA
jgi:hypothetical protein